jgi:hypothetical protein
MEANCTQLSPSEMVNCIPPTHRQMVSMVSVTKSNTYHAHHLSMVSVTKSNIFCTCFGSLGVATTNCRTTNIALV